MEGDHAALQNHNILPISTHALTWRATDYLLYKLGDTSISTHALTWRAT